MQIPFACGTVRLLDVCGANIFGKVYRAVLGAGERQFSCMEIDYSFISPDEREQLKQEISVLPLLNHQNVVRYIEAWSDEAAQITYVLMEHFTMGDLTDVVRLHRKEQTHIAEDRIWDIFTQLLLAMDYCHSVRKPNAFHVGPVVHRNIIPDNIFICDPGDEVAATATGGLIEKCRYKLGYFSFQQILRKNSVIQDSINAPFYMAPEVLLNEGYTEKADVWSLGCVLYELCSLHRPFISSDKEDFATTVKRGEREPLPPHYSQELRILIDAMLDTDPETRPSAANLLARPTFAARGVHQDIIERQEGEIAMLMEDAYQKEETISSLKQTVEQREAHIRQLTEAEEAHTQELASLQETVSAREKTITNLKDQVQDLTNQLDTMTEERDHNLQTIEELRIAHGRMQEEQDRLRQALSEMEARALRAEAEAEALREQLEATERRCSDADEQAGTLADTIADMNALLGEKEITNKNLTQLLRDRQVVITRLENTIGERTAEIERLRQKLERIRGERRTAMHLSRAYEARVGRRNAEISTLKEAVDAADSAKAQAQEAARQAGDQIEDLTTALQSLKTEYDTLTDKYEGEQNLVETLGMKVATLENTAVILEKESRLREEDLATTYAERQNLQEDLERIRALLDERQIHCERLQAEGNRQEEAIEVLKAKLNTLQEEYEQKMALLERKETELEEAHEACTRKTLQLQEAMEQAGIHEAAEQRLASDLDGATLLLKHYENELTDLKLELQSSHQKCASAEALAQERLLGLEEAQRHAAEHERGEEEKAKLVAHLEEALSDANDRVRQYQFTQSELLKRLDITEAELFAKAEENSALEGQVRAYQSENAQYRADFAPVTLPRLPALHIVDTEDDVLLMRAASLGDLSLARSHIRDAGRKDVNGCTALMRAAYHGCYEIASLLREAECLKQDDQGRTALMYAASRGHVNLVRLLQEEQGITDAEGHTALMWAASLNSIPSIETLIGEAKAIDASQVTALMYAAAADAADAVKLLYRMESGRALEDGTTALMMAAARNNAAAVRTLSFDEGQYRDAEGRTALMIAVQAGSDEAARLLIPRQGGMRADDGTTALMLATRRGNLEIARLLFYREAGMVRVDGRTALDEARQQENGPLIELLSTREAALCRQSQVNLDP
ncbi:Kinase, NEK [Giardia muris]|uniref:non-specific serine/threonine protein kinase n=1 Tax=Giardia muris TaxID=5742 RepID=A0A4Z1T1F9_GIAMU|nr:Kinase, NEK [Giardia muris]|eukprot:TNJ26181.1 Kinase, NEK [Giardia muris]